MKLVVALTIMPGVFAGLRKYLMLKLTDCFGGSGDGQQKKRSWADKAGVQQILPEVAFMLKIVRFCAIKY